MLTVEVMIMSRYRYCLVTVFGPTLPTVTTLPTVNDRDRSLPNLVVTCVKVNLALLLNIRCYLFLIHRLLSLT